MKKSIWKALLAVAAFACLCFGAVACNISAGVGSASTETLYSQDLSYIISEDGSYYSVRGIGLCSDRKVVIPNEYRGLPVKEIIDSAFSQCTDLTSIVIPDSVTTIGNYAFEECDSLTSVVIPNSVTLIGNRAFYGCSSLTSIEIPNSVTSIGSSAFYLCYSLTSIYYKGTPEAFSEVELGDNALDNESIYYYVEGGIDVPNDDNDYWFYDENGEIIIVESTLPTQGVEYTLSEYGTYYIVTGYTGTSKKVRIAESYNNLPVREIGYEAFYNKNIVSVIIPDSVTSIGYEAFYGCSRLTSVVIGNSVTSIGYEAFYECSSLTSVVIPDSVTSIGNWAFYECSSLTSVVIPDSVTTIGAGAFYNTSYYNGSSNWENGVLYISKHLIEAKKTISDAYTIKDGTLTIASSAFFECSSLTSVVIPDSVTSIGYMAFYSCSSLTSIEIPDSVTSIGDSAFYGCSGLTSVVIGDGVTSIGERAFEGCSSLTSIVIPDGVTTIGAGAFYGCSGLTSIVIPDGVTTIGAGAFYNTPYYNDSSNWENGVLYISKHLIDTKKTISGAYTIKDGTLTIASSAFWGCSSLMSVVIPDSVTSIGSSAFYNCSSLTNVYITDIEAWCNISGLIYLMSYGSSNKNLYVNNALVTELIIPDSVTTIGVGAFYGCSGLTSVVIPDSVTTIDNWAFTYCSSLTSVVIGDSVTSIEYEAFAECSRLTNVYYKGRASDWSQISIDSYNSSLTNATRYYYSESQPSSSGNYWHYDENGNVAVW